MECSADKQSLQFGMIGRQAEFAIWNVWQTGRVCSLECLADRQSLQFRMFGRQVTRYGKDGFRCFLSVTAKVWNNYGAPIGNARKEWPVWEGLRLR